MLKKALYMFVIGLITVSSILTRSVATDEVTLRETMSLELLEWLYVMEGVDASAVTMDALDRRIRVPECLSSFEFNFPFNDRRTVRVSCREPVWSIVTRVNFTPLAGDQRAQSRESVVTGQETVVYELTVAKRSGDILSGSDIRAVTTTTDRRTLLRGVTRSQIIGAKLARDIPAGSMLQATDILRAHRVITVSSAVPRGATLNETNTTETIFYGNPPADTVRSLAELSRMVVTTQLRPGQPVRFSNLRQQPDVIRGDEVILTVRRGPVTIETTATALEQGVTGEQIRVQSPDSGETFRVLITGVRRVEAAGHN
jgi:flagella basal body P-ring formation protein FlgA